MDTEVSPSPSQDLPALIRSLRETTDLPTPELLEAILAHGPAAVAPLTAFLEEVEAAGSVPERLEEPVGWAAGLLSQLGAVEAAPLLLRLAGCSTAVAAEFTDLMARLGDEARPALHAYLRGDAGRPVPEVRERVVRALGEMGYHAESAALLMERAERHLSGLRPDPDLAQMYGYALLDMRAPEARQLLSDLEANDPEDWFPEREESIAEIMRRGPAPAPEIPDVVAVLKRRRAWRSLHPGEAYPSRHTYLPLPEPDPEEQARKRAARQARRSSKSAPRARPRRR